MKKAAPKDARRGRRGASDRDLDCRVGALIRERRIVLGMSQNELGQCLGISFQQIQKYEKGTNQLSIARLVQICAALDVPISYLLAGLDQAGSPSRRDLEAMRAFVTVTNPAIKDALVRLARACAR